MTERDRVDPAKEKAAAQEIGTSLVGTTGDHPASTAPNSSAASASQPSAATPSADKVSGAVAGTLSALERFGLAVLEESREGLADLDGGWLQDKAEELGLLVRTTVIEPCSDEYCWCADVGFPTDCLRYSQSVQALVETLARERRAVSESQSHACATLFLTSNETIESLKRQLAEERAARERVETLHKGLMQEVETRYEQERLSKEAAVTIAERAEHRANQAESERDAALGAAGAVQEAAAKVCDELNKDGPGSLFALPAHLIRALNIDALEAGRELLEPLRKNDARYRWLRDKSLGQFEQPIVVTQARSGDHMKYVGPLAYSDLDATIDAAMAGGNKT